MRDDRVIWSSTSTEDWIFNCTEADKGDLIEQFLYTDDNEEYYDELFSQDIEELKNMAYDSYIEMCRFGDDLDYEQLKEFVVPMIEEQDTESGYLWVVGNYQRWDGGHDALASYGDIEDGLESICYPDYDSRADICVDKEGNVYFTEYSHDAPMGGTSMYLYLLDDAAAANNLADELFGTDYEYSWQELSDDFEWVKAAIERGILRPVKYDL